MMILHAGLLCTRAHLLVGPHLLLAGSAALVTMPRSSYCCFFFERIFIDREHPKRQSTESIHRRIALLSALKAGALAPPGPAGRLHRCHGLRLQDSRSPAGPALAASPRAGRNRPSRLHVHVRMSLVPGSVSTGRSVLIFFRRIQPPAPPRWWSPPTLVVYVALARCHSSLIPGRRRFPPRLHAIPHHNM